MLKTHDSSVDDLAPRKEHALPSRTAYIWPIPMFGFFKRRSTFRHMSDRMKINNVREMLKMRLADDPVARSSEIDPDDLDDQMVDGLPEMTVFKQVQCYLMFRCDGASDVEALKSLYEMHQ